MAEGVDGASRAGDDFGPGCNVESSLGPAVSDALWSSVLRVSAAAGWRITVDAFATESNARAPRFWSPFLEPGAEAADALSVLDWAVSRFPVWSADHREVIYAFPPLHLLRHALAKAIEDRARCALVVAVITPHWNKLLTASVLPPLEFPDGFLRVRNHSFFTPVPTHPPSSPSLPVPLPGSPPAPAFQTTGAALARGSSAPAPPAAA